MKRKDIWPFVLETFERSSIKDSTIWGLGHVIRVREMALKVIDLCDLDPRLEAALQVSAELHDIGKALPIMGVSHAEASASVMRNLEIEDIEEAVWSAANFAVRFHTDRYKEFGDLEDTSVMELRFQVLGLLELCDHSDVFSCAGMARNYIAMVVQQGLGKLPILSKRFSAEEIQRLIKEGFPSNFMSRSDSFVTHSAYNLWGIYGFVVPPVRCLLSEEFLDFLNDERSRNGSLVTMLLELQKQHDLTKQ